MLMLIMPWGSHWSRTRPESHPSLVVDATGSQATYSQAKTTGAAEPPTYSSGNAMGSAR